MKTIVYILFSCLLFAFNSNGQIAEVKTIPILKSNTLNIETEYLDVKIQTWNKDYIQWDSELTINLTSGKDNHNMEIENESDGIRIISSIDTESIEKMVITRDKEGNRTYTTAANWDETMKGKSFMNMNYGYEIDGQLSLTVPEDMTIIIETLYGDAHIDGEYEAIRALSTYGMVEAKLNDVNKMKEVNFKSVYDLVDLALEENSRVSLNLKTTYGSVFSNLPLQSKDAKYKSDHHSCSSSAEKYVLNNGDVAIDIIATYNNIYVRSF